MKLCLISDIHGNLIDIPSCDLLLIAGDVTPFYGNPNNKQVFRTLNWVNNEFSNWLSNINAKDIVLIAGNHDFVFEDHLANKEIKLPNNVHYLYNSSVHINGLNIWGSPYTPRFGGWAFNTPEYGDEGENYLDRIYNNIPDNTDIVITHGPAYGILDKVSNTRHGEHAGSKALLNAIKRVNPKIHLSGHIHEGYGVFHNLEVASTYFYNASIVLYDTPVNKVIKIDI